LHLKHQGGDYDTGFLHHRGLYGDYGGGVDCIYRLLMFRWLLTLALLGAPVASFADSYSVQPRYNAVGQQFLTRLVRNISRNIPIGLLFRLKSLANSGKKLSTVIGAILILIRLDLLGLLLFLIFVRLAALAQVLNVLTRPLVLPARYAILARVNVLVVPLLVHRLLSLSKPAPLMSKTVSLILI
jgi:hypothetical protein